MSLLGTAAGSRARQLQVGVERACTSSTYITPFENDCYVLSQVAGSGPAESAVAH
jgi:hypothetical protein